MDYLAHTVAAVRKIAASTIPRDIIAGMSHIESSGNMAGWPPNVAGKPTQVAVFGMYHPDKGRVVEILWTGQFPDLEPAMYWAARKEMHAVRKQKWLMASRVLWQHELTPEQAVAVSAEQMKPQVDRALAQYLAGFEPTLGDGPMKPIDHSRAQGYYVEVADEDGNDVLPGMVLPPEDYKLLRDGLARPPRPEDYEGDPFDR